jgi:hypothetical protein
MPSLGIGSSVPLPDQCSASGLCATVSYTSDFSSGTDSFAAGGNISGEDTNLTVTGNIDGIGGRDDNLRLRYAFTAGLTAANRATKKTGFSFSAGCTYNISFSYFFASSNVNANILTQLVVGGATYVNPDGESAKSLNTWHDFSATGFVAGDSGELIFKFPYDDDDNSTDEVVYIRNVVIATP